MRPYSLFGLIWLSVRPMPGGEPAVGPTTIRCPAPAYALSAWHDSATRHLRAVLHTVANPPPPYAVCRSGGGRGLRS